MDINNGLNWMSKFESGACDLPTKRYPQVWPNPFMLTLPPSPLDLAGARGGAFLLGPFYFCGGPWRCYSIGAVLLKALWGGQPRRLLFTIGNRVEVTGKHGMLIKIGKLTMRNMCA